MQPPLLKHPIVVQVGKQLAVPQLERVAEAPLDSQALGLPQVHRDLRALGEAHAIALPDDVFGARLAELAPERGQRGPQTGPSTGVEHIGPEHRSHARPRVQTRVIGKPREQRTRPATRDRLELSPAKLDTKLTDESDPQHPAASLLAAVAPNPALDPASDSEGWRNLGRMLARGVRGGVCLCLGLAIAKDEEQHRS